MLVEFVLGVNESLGHRYVYVYRLRHQRQRVKGRKVKVRRRTLALQLTFVDSGSVLEERWYWDPDTLHNVVDAALHFFASSRRRKLVDLRGKS